jgi:hypothetical protein
VARNYQANWEVSVLESKPKLPEDLIVLLRQLVKQGQISIAAIVLSVYFRREWRLDDDMAGFYTRRYFEKHYSDYVRKHRERMPKAL